MIIMSKGEMILPTIDQSYDVVVDDEPDLYGSDNHLLWR